jgi:hypothetical protein
MGSSAQGFCAPQHACDFLRVHVGAAGRTPGAGMTALPIQSPIAVLNLACASNPFVRNRAPGDRADADVSGPNAAGQSKASGQYPRPNCAAIRRLSACFSTAI